MDVRAFLADHPPFDALTPEELDRVVASVQIEHFAPGTVILQQAGAPATHLFVVRRGVAEIVDGGRVIDELGEGDVFGMWSLLGQVAPTATVRAGEDTLCYLIDAEVANAVLRSGGGIVFVAASVRRRIFDKLDASQVSALESIFTAINEGLHADPACAEARLSTLSARS